MSSDWVLDAGWYDEDAQLNPLWVAWKSPEAIASRLERLWTVTVPTWTDETPPDVDRFAQAEVDWLCDVFDSIFTDRDALEEPDNRQAADEFVTYFGEALIARAGGEWFAKHYGGDVHSPLFDGFNPAVGYRWEHSPDDLTDLLYEAVEVDGGPDAVMEVGQAIYNRDFDHKEAFGLPGGFDEVRRRPGLA
ncbi:hypothetical protein [Nocardia tengchongensis]|uniref:hypothetical protein n=1 Tax=Nocardia tengchongensis TaxID=2055889 RepID=UPI00367BECCC